MRRASVADLNGARNGEIGKYVADQFMVRIVKPREATNSVE